MDIYLFFDPSPSQRPLKPNVRERERVCAGEGGGGRGIGGRAGRGGGRCGDRGGEGDS